MMWGRWAMAAAALALLCGAGGDSGRVTKLNRAMTSVYDENLKFEGREESWKLPAGGAPIVDASRPGYVAITRDSRKIYLRLSEVTTEGLHPGDCVVTAAGASGASSAHIAGSGGFGSMMSDGKSICVPK
ncbi:MAG TPA: hypothetical protein VMQ93_13630 [Novosphingobium sp.]|nr:hypothetical protein [Novosphingobium sp.]